MPDLNVLIVGGGGREHTLAWALRQSPRVGRLHVAPGNAGTASIAENVSIAADNIAGLVDFARVNAIDLTVVGPEAPLAAGIVDAFRAAGLRIFGPTQAAARLESSKAFAKQFMADHGIPTAAHATFTDYDAAVTYVNKLQRPLVVKADGLAAGKGVTVCDTPQQAIAALSDAMLDAAFGAAGQTVVIEERLTGPELSVHAFCDGHTIRLLPPARDHKRAYDNDDGPNTGGMGAYTPVPGVDAALLDEITRTMLQPAVDGMIARGTPYTGMLYAGLMLTPDGPRTLEFNCRFGDPETQVMLPLLNSDLAEVLLACVEGRLGEIDIDWRPGACATVVAAAPGYPNDYPKGSPITGMDLSGADTLIFHAGTAQQDGEIVTAGGRVLAVSAVGADLDAALASAYATLDGIHFEGMHYRRDIGHAQAR